MGKSPFLLITKNKERRYAMPCENVKECSCPKTDCERYKKCCECVKSHKERGYLPHCLRPLEQPAEKKPETDEKA